MEDPSNQHLRNVSKIKSFLVGSSLGSLAAVAGQFGGGRVRPAQSHALLFVDV